ncbi:MAG: GNAT family N-acetyltransferase [Pseudomarimonas sp.]
MSLCLRWLGSADHQWHPAWLAGVHAVFKRADFSRWIQWGEWTDDYQVACLFDGERAVAGASLTRMSLLLEGEPTSAMQLGAVFCLPSHRGRGLGGRVLQATLEHCGDTPVMLFGNPDVRDFYPRFGFSACAQQRFSTEFSCKPAGSAATTLDPSDPAIRARIHHLAAAGVSESRRFTARNHGRIITWYYANGFARTLCELADDLLIVAANEGDTLHIDAVLTTRAIDLSQHVSRLIDRPVRRISFGFTPDLCWPWPCATRIDTEADLFVRGFERLPSAPSHFPLLART